MHKRASSGVGILVLSAVIVVIILISVAMLSQVNKTKIIERSISTEYDLKTYYVAMAGINECIAYRMSPRSNIINTKMKTNSLLKSIFADKRISDSGVVRSDPYSTRDEDILGRYTYVSYAAKYVKGSSLYIDELNNDEKTQKYLVYSKGVTKLANGKEDSLIIKALFDISRDDEDTFNADEIELIGVLPPNDSELPFAEKLIAANFADRTPPKPHSITFTTSNGTLVSVDLSKKKPVNPQNINIRTKISIKFTEPIDSDFLDGITLKNVKDEPLTLNPDKIAISPKNTEVILFPAKKKNGKNLNFASPYKIEITGVADNNGNIMQDIVLVGFNTEMPNLLGFDEVNSDSGESVTTLSEAGCDTGVCPKEEQDGKKLGSRTFGVGEPRSPFTPVDKGPSGSSYWGVKVKPIDSSTTQSNSRTF